MTMAGAMIDAPDAHADGAHIVLETGEADDSAERPQTVAAQFELKSLFRGTCVQLTLFKEGFVAVSTDHGGARRREQLLNLRYLEPRPKISRVSAPRTLYFSAGSAALAGALVAVASLELLAPIATVLVASLLGAIAVVLAWSFFYQTGERIVFSTARGQVEVLALFGTLGSVGALRRIVPALVTAIRDAAEPLSSPNARLREEIREHYRLARAGAISDHACSTGTQRILTHFA